MAFYKRVRLRTNFRLVFGTFCLVAAALISLQDFFMRQNFSFQKSPIERPLAGGSAPEEIQVEEASIDETLTLSRGDTLITALSRAQIKGSQAQELIQALKKVFNPRDLRPEHEIYITYMPVKDGPLKRELMAFYLRPSLSLEIVVKRDPSGNFVGEKNVKTLKHDVKAAEGRIQDSLYMDAGKKGVPPKILHEMIQVFSYDVDFQRSVKSGDGYDLMYDMYSDPDSLREESGTLLYANLILRDRKLEVFRFQPSKGVVGYYNAKGESVKKGLLRTPIDGARISGRFGRRKHPVLGYSKMHKGVDFAAPRGTPIMAAGDGVVVKIGRWGTYGNYIKVKHNGEYSTAYAHLSRYAKGLKRGSRVRQGQVIGYVGATGRATGNHLHYELIRYNKQINPNRIKMLPTRKLKGRDLKVFQAHVAKVRSQRSRLGASPQVAKSSGEARSKASETSA